ncbi:MAG: glycosyltransferase family 4 protein [Prolixibacteraceae bacterium]|nr:glycosyltransferase family 4 protein [Prolixibacteraceae bacterium]
MKKKILFLLHIPPPVHGSSIVGLFIKESVLINEEFNCSYINLLASQNVAESGVVSFGKILGFLRTFYQVFISLLRNRPQLCYMALSTTGTAFFKDSILIALLKVFRVKRIYHLHNKGVSQYEYKTFNNFCYNFVFRNSEVIVLSEKLYPDIQSYVPFQKVYICPNGVNDEVPKAQVRSFAYENSSEDEQISLMDNKLPLPKKNTQILFLSNLIESKGVFILIDACSLLVKKGIRFECVFIGGEGNISASQFNEKINKSGLKDYVSYKGKKFGEEKNSAFQEADIFVFPTYEDCFPLVLVESMSHSLPIVTTFEGGISDIVEDGITGFFVPQKNAEELAEKLEILILDSYLRQKMGKAGRKKYEQNFTLEIFQNRMIDILKDVIEKD